MYDVAETEAETYHTGPEMQVLDDAGHKDGQDSQDVGGRALRSGRAQGKVLKPVGEWNQARLVKRGHVEHWLNGTKILEYELGSPALAVLIADSKFKEWPRFAKQGQGHIVLQHHGDQAWFRNIRITGTPVEAAPSFDRPRGRGPARGCPGRPAPRAAARTCRPRPRRSCA